MGQHRGRSDGGPARTAKSFRFDKVPSTTLSLFLVLKPYSNSNKPLRLRRLVHTEKDINSKMIREHNAKNATSAREGAVQMEVFMCLEGCSMPPGCCEAGPVKGELQTKVFYSSGANGDK